MVSYRSLVFSALYNCVRYICLAVSTFVEISFSLVSSVEAVVTEVYAKGLQLVKTPFSFVVKASEGVSTACYGFVTMRKALDTSYAV